MYDEYHHNEPGSRPYSAHSLLLSLSLSSVSASCQDCAHSRPPTFAPFGHTCRFDTLHLMSQEFHGSYSFLLAPYNMQSASSSPRSFPSTAIARASAASLRR
eukprot:GHVU01171067.1.p2 GENE.GHVU01171067.1~~GHVU01171067.1.p2  ORF type:complete len:102 (-),score=2.56 GHVU01171067.1:171-476(-)